MDCTAPSGHQVGPRARLAAVALALLTGAEVLSGQSQVFQARTDLVTLDVSVRKGNVPIQGLQPNDFLVLDNGVRQTVTEISFGTVPIDVTIFFDTSGTTIGDLGNMKRDFETMAAMLRPTDRLRLLSFADQVVETMTWRAPSAGLSLGGLSESTVNSPIYDALNLALLQRPDPDRRHLVVGITDGLDNGSTTSSATVRAVARGSDSALSIVLIPNGLPPNSDIEAPGQYASRSVRDQLSESNLADAAESSGGRFYRTPIIDTRNRVVNAFKELFDEFRLSYVLRYEAQGVPRAGWHDLRVEVTDHHDYSIHARRGYYGSQP